MSKYQFYSIAEKEEKENYVKYLSLIGSLSNLFSNSESPFIHYRSMEKIFCKTFFCDDLSRCDITIDAKKGSIGIGLKTFLHNENGSFQKIAEFNKLSYKLKEIKDDLELVKEVAILRNKRIQFAMESQGVEDTIYHVVTRTSHKLYIFEEEMLELDIENIVLDNVKNTYVHFNDGIHDYSFSKSKNTLLMKFFPNPIKLKEIIDVAILDDPIGTLKKITTLESGSTIESKTYDYTILPLYSDRTNQVHEKSGLNMWNAEGRTRDLNEVYIPIPIWIHRFKNNFFNYREGTFKSLSFSVALPNGNILSMKVTQSNGKALQSNPNKALGKWILRQVLKIPEGELVTKEILDELNIDSVQLSKIDMQNYELDFLPSGSYKEYKDDNL